MGLVGMCASYLASKPAKHKHLKGLVDQEGGPRHQRLQLGAGHAAHPDPESRLLYREECVLVVRKCSTLGSRGPTTWEEGGKGVAPW